MIYVEDDDWLLIISFSLSNGPRLVVKKKWKPKTKMDFIHKCYVHKIKDET